MSLRKKKKEHINIWVRFQLLLKIIEYYIFGVNSFGFKNQKLLKSRIWEKFCFILFFYFLLSDAKSNLLSKRERKIQNSNNMFKKKKKTLPKFSRQKIEARMEESDTATLLLKEKIWSKNLSPWACIFQKEKFYGSYIHEYTHYCSLRLLKKDSHFNKITKKVNVRYVPNALYILTSFKKVMRLIWLIYIFKIDKLRYEEIK